MRRCVERLCRAYGTRRAAAPAARRAAGGPRPRLRRRAERSAKCDYLIDARMGRDRPRTCSGGAPSSASLRRRRSGVRPPRRTARQAALTLAGGATSGRAAEAAADGRPHPRHRPGHDLDAGRSCSIASSRSSAMAQREFPQHFPQLRLGRARSGGHLATRWSPPAARRSARRASQPRDIAAIGITNQRETTLRLGPQDRRSRSTTPSSGRTGAPPSLRAARRPPGTSRR